MASSRLILLASQSSFSQNAKTSSPVSSTSSTTNQASLSSDDTAFAHRGILSSRQTPGRLPRQDFARRLNARYDRGSTRAENQTSKMSAYSRDINVSQFLRDLQNQDASPENLESMDDDLSMFTNTHFYDYDTGLNTDFQAHPIKPETVDPKKSKADEAAPAQPAVGDFASLDVDNFLHGDFNFPEFGNTYSSPTIQQFPDNLNLHAHPSSQPVYPAVQHPQPAQQQPGYAPQVAPRAGEKRKADARPISFEEQSRLAAEEDKRRRNTAASARFRIKKKAREQALEKSAKEMNEKVTALEGRIQQLETENKWLKNMVLEKNGGNEEYLSKLMEDLNNKSAAEFKNGAKDRAAPKAEARKSVDLANDMSG
ncbi:uncharacterized protein E0L32_008831 [Thyridium curvatum]|uniref:BZIP domain-containing protein n=1 Tax=Thyridium curvatum TaxID=1093900 RepID=A0A507AU17_9PEZI|nr:uncharacterized protein E0L32_008831 [Thyridium curvatum]TPX09984.1 hypothetical protein E0L32_008831 [Thyridium curvatum]